MKKKILVKTGDTFVKVPMDYITLDVPNEGEEEVEIDNGIIIKGNMSELKINQGEHTNKIIALVPHIQADVAFPRNIGSLRVSYNNDVKMAYTRVRDAYKRKHRKLKIRSRVGLEIRFDFQKDGLTIHRNSVNMRVAGSKKEVLFPNVYTGDGRICWGDGNTLPSCEKPEQMANRLVQLFFNAPFNLDLGDKYVKISLYLQYIQHCIDRVRSLTAWTEAEKRDMLTWLQAEAQQVRQERTNSSSGNCLAKAYIVWLMTSIFEDDICEVASHISSSTLEF